MSRSDADRFHRAEAIFLRVGALPAAKRAAALAEACGDDDALRREVETLLSADAETRGPLDAPAFGQRVDVEASVAAAQASAAREGPGSQLGPYKLLEVLGEGGFGVVYLAEQREPVTRRVAVKVVKLGMDTRQVLARFEAERQALALMDHPHIATVLDAGTTDAGRPYFVMELVDGTPITSYCDEHELSLPERLELFGQVCRAVQHAHQKGVIHRDVKPSNVLVSTRDGRPFARVIDFGIAKAVESRLTERTLFTMHGQLIGTPEYMSPEQAAGASDVDTRSDVYALGVLLYELLTGSTPFDRTELREAALGEIQRMIQDVDPPTPSTRLSREREALEGVAARRRTDPRRLGTLVRGELDWIVMRALEKDRGRRYQSAGELASDVTAHLAGDPIVAAPRSRSYRARTFVRRNKGVVTAASLVAGALVVAVVGTSWGLATAIDEADRADRLAEEESAQRALAESRADELEEVVRFQASQLSDIDPSVMGERLRASILELAPEAAQPALAGELESVNFTDVALGSLRTEILDRALETIDADFADQPVLRARLLETVADTALALGLIELAARCNDDALALREAELGGEHPDVGESLHRLMVVMLEDGRFAEAEPIGRRAIEILRATRGPDYDTTLDAIGAYGAVLRALDRLDEALPFYQEALEGHRRTKGPDDPTTLVALNNMAFLYRATGREEASAALFRETLERRRRVHGLAHSSTLTSMMNLAAVLRRAGDLEAAEPLYLEALEGHRRLHGDDHPRTISSMNGVAVFHFSQGKYEEAAALLREAFERTRAAYGLDHRDTLIFAGNLGNTYRQLGRFEEAEAMVRLAFERSAALFGETSREHLRHGSSLAQLEVARGDRAAGIARLEAVLATAREHLGEQSPDVRGMTGLLERLKADSGG